MYKSLKEPAKSFTLKSNYGPALSPEMSESSSRLVFSKTEQLTPFAEYGFKAEDISLLIEQYNTDASPLTPSAANMLKILAVFGDCWLDKYLVTKLYEMYFKDTISPNSYKNAKDKLIKNKLVYIAKFENRNADGSVNPVSFDAMRVSTAGAEFVRKVFMIDACNALDEKKLSEVTAADVKADLESMQLVVKCLSSLPIKNFTVKPETRPCPLAEIVFKPESSKEEISCFIEVFRKENNWEEKAKKVIRSYKSAFARKKNIPVLVINCETPEMNRECSKIVSDEKLPLEVFYTDDKIIHHPEAFKYSLYSFDGNGNLQCFVFKSFEKDNIKSDAKENPPEKITETEKTQAVKNTAAKSDKKPSRSKAQKAAAPDKKQTAPAGNKNAEKENSKQADEKKNAGTPADNKTAVKATTAKKSTAKKPGNKPAVKKVDTATANSDSVKASANRKAAPVKKTAVKKPADKPDSKKQNDEKVKNNVSQKAPEKDVKTTDNSKASTDRNTKPKKNVSSANSGSKKEKKPSGKASEKSKTAKNKIG